MPEFKRGRKITNWRSPRPTAKGGKLRIIGGTFRGRQIQYSGDSVTRPMKDNIREALFNLVGGWVKGKAAFDLFAGTGAMGLEALSRGATQALFIERHFPTVRIIKENVRSLDENLQAEVTASDTFFWVRKFLKQPEQWPTEPWIVFCCPPYALFEEQRDDILVMLKTLMEAAPKDSLFVVESDDRFDPSLLPNHEGWTSRQYTPALISVYREREFEGDEVDQSASEVDQSASEADQPLSLIHI